MSLFRAIFAFRNGREVATFGFVSSVWVRSAFALPSLWVRSGSTPNSEGKVDSKWDEDALDITYLFVG